MTVKDSGTHGALDWLLRKWGLHVEVEELDKALAGKPHGDRNWYVNGQGQTFAIITGGVFQKGVPKWDPRHPDADWLTYTVEIDRVFAFAAKEVTRADWSQFSSSNKDVWQADEVELDRMGKSEDCTMKGITWYEAAHYCNWLSEQEGIPASQWCFEPNPDGKYAEGMKVKEKFLDLKGYRLPTDPEREFFCRAGNKSTFLFGNQQKYINQYGHSTKESAVHPVGLLKPNGLGFFDMYGNGTSWVLDIDLPRYAQEHSNAMPSSIKKRLTAMRSGEKLLDRPVLLPVEDKISRLMWGVNFEYSYATNSCHLNDRLLEINLSIRPVRTLSTIQLNE